MDPITGFVLGLLMIAISVAIQIITWPFRKAKEVAAAHPRRTARLVIGAVAAGLVAYLLGAPYVVEVSFAGGMAGVILGEIFS